ncbi:MAG TPA: signal peptide peptidase SppA [Telluria sp.]
MSFKPFTAIRRGFGMFWRALDATRRTIFNLIFLTIVIVILVAMFTGGAKPLADKTTLVLELKGELVEQHSATVRETLMSGIGAGEARRTIQLRDMLDVLDNAAKDSKITTVLLMLDEFDVSGMANLHEMGAALDRVRAAGKKVVAWGGSFDQKNYLIATHASEIYVHPMGMVMLEGFGRHRNYYRDALDKLGVTVNLIKVGTFKSFAEPYIGNGPSPAAAEADAFLYNALWANYTAEVEKFRKLPAGTIDRGIAALPETMTAASGNAAQVALNAKLVDGIKTRDEVRDLLGKYGARDVDNKTFRQVSFNDYLARHPQKMFGDAVGVIVAEGSISDGTSGPGSIGGLSTANLIRRARNDDQVKAVVLRVDSPGGSAYGSELIRRELELTRAAGKPVVVSMGGVAASGGYWISMASDEVIADPATVTGSIGVFAILPTAEKVADKLGIHTVGTTTTWLADSYNPLRPLDPRFGQLIQSSINHIYSDFTTKAAAARKMPVAAVDAVAQGRVWTGAQAKERGLVDRLGSYNDALASAAARAKLGKDFRVAYVERQGNPFERLLQSFGVSTEMAVNIQVKLGVLDGLPTGAATAVAKDMSFLSDMADRKKPFAAITHCMCELP